MRKVVFDKKQAAQEPQAKSVDNRQKNFGKVPKYINKFNEER